MAQPGVIKPTHRAIQRYYDSLKRLSGEHVTHELGLRPAFQNLLEETAKVHGWSFISELTTPGAKGHAALRPDGTVRDGNSLPRGYWEAKDTSDALHWVIDQYQVSEDKRSGIKSDPNRPDDGEYIVRLVGQVVRVSVETVKIVKGLPKEYGANSGEAIPDPKGETN
jgi:hypothetical protein